MLINNKFFFKLLGKENIGQNCFYCGTFFLGSALPVSILFYLVSILLTFKYIKLSFKKDKYTQLLLVSSGIMIFSSINSILNLRSADNYSLVEILISLFNWLPLFVLFCSAQNYLKTTSQREIFSRCLISGTVPVIFSCAMQAWFGIEGPLKLFNGLIVWYLDKVDSQNIYISGLFSNRNYAATWFSTVICFSLFELLKKNKSKYEKLFIVILNFFLVFFTLLTFSRNGLISLFIAFVIIFRKYKLVLPVISFYAICNLTFLYLLNNKVFNLLENSDASSFKDFILLKISRIFLTNPENFFNFNRIEIFTKAFELILQNPILGWGASTFSEIYKQNNGISNVQHTHNIFLELAFNYGIPLSILIAAIIFKLIIDCYKLIYFNASKDQKSLIDICWLASISIICINQLTDITYYDGKISILIWILISGIKCIIQQKKLDLTS